MNAMRRLGPVLLAAGMGAGCVTVSALTFVGSTSTPKDEACSCIHRYLTSAGYELDSADRAGGIIKVTRPAPDPVLQSTHDAAMHDFMSFTLVKSMDPKKCSLQASVDGYVRTADGEKSPHEPWRVANVDAWAVINQCYIEDVHGIHPLDVKKL